MDIGTVIGLCCGIGIPLALILGGALGFYIATKYFKNQMKKNPPISESQIRAMYSQMGRKPTESQVKAVMASFKKNTKKK